MNFNYPTTIGINELLYPYAVTPDFLCKVLPHKYLVSYVCVLISIRFCVFMCTTINLSVCMCLFSNIYFILFLVKVLKSLFQKFNQFSKKMSSNLIQIIKFVLVLSLFIILFYYHPGQRSNQTTTNKRKNILVILFIRKPSNPSASSLKSGNVLWIFYVPNDSVMFTPNS